MQPFARTLCLLLALLGCLLPAAMANPPEFASYIVVLDDRVAAPATAAREIAGATGGQVGFVYEHALKGFSLTVPPYAAAALQKNPLVRLVAPDDLRKAGAQVLPTGLRRAFVDQNPALDIDGSDDFRIDVDVAVIDTGIDFQHPDLNVVGGITCATGGPFNSTCVAGGDDDNYHGTHVAGTIGAIDNGDGVVGVAPGARLWAVKVLNSRGSGFTSWIIAGIDWVAANAAIIEVANMSLGGSYNEAECLAIQGAVNKGVAFAVAAGNEDDDARNYGPAACSSVLTVSALADFDGLAGSLGNPTCTTDQDDTLADFSNWGPAVDLAAPGVCIYSTYPLERGGYGTLSGTSMATPHAAGALALLASVANPASSAEVLALYEGVTGNGNFDWIDDSGDGSKEPLLDVRGFPAALLPTGAPNTPPVVVITAPADGATFASGETISFTGTATDPQQGDLGASLTWTSSLAGTIGTGTAFTRALGDGTHTIIAAVTDAGGLTGSDSIAISVIGSSAEEILLSVKAYKVKNVKYADLAWSGTTAAETDVRRDGSIIATTANDGSYTDGPIDKSIKKATYQVCEAGTEACSNPVTVSW